MHNDSQPKNLLNAAAASRCWVARAGTARKPWPHPYWPYGASTVEPGTLPQNMRGPSLGAGAASAQKPTEQDSR